MNKKPNFFIVGAAKCGTTSLYKWLGDHPEVYFPDLKEPHLFCFDEMNRWYYYKTPIIGSLDNYQTLFQGVQTESRIGEASVHYLVYEDVPQRLKAFTPDAKIIIMLRDPIARAYSHYLMDYRSGYLSAPFSDVLDRSRELDLVDFYHEHVGLGLYAESVQRYIDTFGASNVHIELFDDLVADSAALFIRVQKFLGLDDKLVGRIALTAENPFRMPRTEIAFIYRNYHVRTIINGLLPKKLKQILQGKLLSTDRPQMDLKSFRILKAAYSDDVDQTARVLGRSLDRWQDQWSRRERELEGAI